MLNRSKGSAVWGPRVQADRKLFGAAVRAKVAAEPMLDVIEGEVTGLRVESGRVSGVSMADGSELSCSAAILCTGTFLGGVLFRGEERFEGGRIGEGTASVLAEQLREVALPMARLKTGTPPRLDGRTIDWSRLLEQPSDSDDWTMSPMSSARRNPQVFCAITRTNPACHDIIRANLSRSPLYSGAIDAKGRGKAHWVACDLAGNDAADTLAKAVADKLGAADILVANTGGPPPGRMIEADLSGLTTHFNQMVLRVIETADRLLPAMRKVNPEARIETQVIGEVAELKNSRGIKCDDPVAFGRNMPHLPRLLINFGSKFRCRRVESTEFRL